MYHEIIRTRQDAIDHVNRQHRLHRGKWLTKEAIKEYRNKAKKIPNENPADHKERRKLEEEFRIEYGLTFLEAENILNGYNIADYLLKYNRIKNRIPLNIKSKKTDS
jgi:hypothetical protein